MIITCDNCKTRYNLDDSLIRNKPVISVRCSKCDNKFKVPVEKDQDVELPASSIVSTQWDTTIAVSNQKGGVAKTSTCLNMGVSLSMMGKKVLLVDFDVQANLTISLGHSVQSGSFFDILQEDANAMTDYIQATRYDNLECLPANSRMALLTKHHIHRQNFEFLLREKLATISGRYDYIIIDTPPALDFCTLNALMAAHCVIIPTPCEYLSMHGIHRIEDIIKIIRKKTGRDIDYRILVTMYDPQSTAARVIYQKIQNMFPDKLLNTVIENDQRLKESQIVHLPVYHYENKSISARQYQELAREIAMLTA